MLKRQLVLEDSSVFIGEGFGSETMTMGEIVFHTGMTGYQEVISDPSASGQIVVMTNPSIGNYGMNRDDMESTAPSVHGVITKAYEEYPSNFRSEETLNDFLKRYNIPGIAGIDTRKLTKTIRQHGTVKGCIAPVSEPVETLVSQLRQTPMPTNLVSQISIVKPYVVPGRGRRIVLVDFGMKHGVLRELTKRDNHVTVVPYNYRAKDILQLKPDGILLSNGPGDPKAIPEVMEMVQDVLGQLPLFGIGLGHQLFALACGANTEKMKFGHHGTNHPVKDLETGRTYMTGQHHSYDVTHESLGRTNLALTQIALNDHSVEGIKHTVYPAFSVQYYPEGAPGPNDANPLFDAFLQMIDDTKEAGKGEQTYA
ncbi:carbamoyl phosphate synthase small subunit [Lentibacillus sp. L22]|uniref:carbamoyl phosphate synthase small subunit n=1 Tax=Lentibacillus TaxID=175304 RepID=UPI0022B1B496|nr:carbamoyl phosphate synthase small subunit [Lentibacillus daqui]